MSEPKRPIDLRSDTVTKPTQAMLRAMTEAELGDDVYQEDPTVNLLEARAAALLGKEAALFVPTGTMGNTIALKLNTEHGQEVLCETRSHVFNYELAMMAWFCGCLARPVTAPSGILTWDLLKPHLKPLGPHAAPTGMISLENTHNMAGGTVTPVEVTDDICRRAHHLGLRVHIDGARIFNAATCLHLPAARLAAHADTVMFCLSKGLCAPAGSLVAGSRKDMDRARLYRKRLGGGMRQAGILAAAGLLALEEMPKRLTTDHAHARLLAEGLARIGGVAIDPTSVQTNIVIFDLSALGLTGSECSERLREQGVLANAVGEYAVRMVTHHGVSAAECERALAATASVLSRYSKASR
ncbi:MAG: aminotransferase class I/II-fold pyridoxal phosphate-dependent enzyme [Bryobacterales bacterium]|nr:aminotransferase class I/II-fold pyridoxal phosphate-dependent enzyme [Bryobacterales bacterium]